MGTCCNKGVQRVVSAWLLCICTAATSATGKYMLDACTPSCIEVLDIKDRGLFSLHNCLCAVFLFHVHVLAVLLITHPHFWWRRFF